MTNKDELIEIVTNEGQKINCELFDMVEFQNRYYALLVEENHAEDPEPELMIYRYRELGDDVYFEQITDAGEFKDVAEYVESIAGSEG